MSNMRAMQHIVQDAIELRHDFHRHPELMYDTHRTASIVADRLEALGFDEVVTGIGRTGVVGVLKGRLADTGRVIALRADMDALPIEEETDVPYRSVIAGKMHACGHDGHTAILLGTARCLATSRDFGGTVVLVFQPAEEGGGGAKAMLEDGLVSRFKIGEIYGLHNRPGMAVGDLAVRAGPIMAASDRFTIDISGVGGHAGAPHKTVDTLLVASHIVIAAQSIVSRSLDPLASAVVSITACQGGQAFNVMPQSVQLRGSVRSLSPAIRDLCRDRLDQIVTGCARTFGAEGRLDYREGYPVTINHEAQAGFAAQVAAELFGDAHVDRAFPTVMGAEDFSFMLQALPGAFIFMGNGATAGLHHPRYDFNDAAIAPAIAFWNALVHQALKAR